MDKTITETIFRQVNPCSIRGYIGKSCRYSETKIGFNFKRNGKLECYVIEYDRGSDLYNIEHTTIDRATYEKENTETLGDIYADQLTEICRGR